MLRHLCHIAAGICLLLALPCAALAQYRAERIGDVVTLSDQQHKTSVSILPSMGDLIFRMMVNGQNVIYFPYAKIEDYQQHPSFSGIPFLAPWANRLDEQGFYANGKHYSFNMTLGNVRGATPIHGFLSQAPWDVVELKADKQSAWLTARLDFYRHPDWMAQFPFAHTIEITQRLHDGVLEVHTRLDNLSTDPMPVAIGYHPYLRLTDSPREDWTIHVSAKTHYLLQSTKIPSGETEPIGSFFKDPDAAALKDYNLDDVFGDLVRGSDGHAHFEVSGKQQHVSVEFGPKFQSAILFSPSPKNATAPAAPRPGQTPPDPNFICFEPMASITDAMNLEHAGKFTGVQTIPPGGTWEESFWIIPSGF